MTRLGTVLERRIDRRPPPELSSRRTPAPAAAPAPPAAPTAVGLFLQHALLAFALAASMRPLWLLYAPAPRPHLLAVGAAALALAAGCRHLRWSASTQTMVLLAVMPVAVLAFGGRLAAIAEGPAQLLSMRPPLMASAELVTVLIVTSWLAATVTAALARVSEPVLAVLGPLALLLGGALVAAPYRVAGLWWGVAVVALALLATAVARWTGAPAASDRQRQPASTWLGAVGLVAAAALVGGAAGAGFERFSEPVALREPPSQGDETLVLTNPLASLKAIRTDGVTDALVTVQASDGVVPPLRLVAFDGYDGVRWTTGAVLERSGPLLGGASLAPASQTVGYDVALSARFRSLPALAPFVPLVSGDESVARAPISLSTPGLLSDADAGVVVIGSTGAPGVDTYRLEAQVTDHADLDPSSYQSLVSDDTAGYLTVDRAPEQLDALLAEAAQRAAANGQPSGSPGEQLAALRALLLEDFAHNPDAVPGHSTARLDAFIGDERSGSAEQFAAVFALAARRLGFPARVVVGFRPAEQEPTGAPSDGPVSYRSADLTTWPELAVADVGWVALDVLPERLTPTPVVPPAVDDAADRSLTPTRDAFEDVPELIEEDAEGFALSGAALVGVAIATPLAIVMVGALATILIAKQRRRRVRRRRGDPGDRALGAWAELRDRLLEHGVPIRRGLSPSEQIGLAAESLGPELTAELPALIDPIDWAVYDRAGPSESAAAQAWDIVDGYRQLARHRLPIGVRVRATFDPRPLFQNRR